MIYSDLMTIVEGAKKSVLSDRLHVKKGISVQDHVKQTYKFTIQARTLTDILIQEDVRDIDFFSLDVEGYELEVLRGTDLENFRPHYILVETRFPNEINDYLHGYDFQLIDYLSHHDILYMDKQVNQTLNE